MTFITVQFDYPQTRGLYEALYKALKKSIEINCPDARLHSITVPPPKNPKAWRGATSNTVKLDYWIKALETIEDDNFIFIDCDMIVLKDMEHVFDKDFDICYTTRESKFPINGGVVFVKKNERSIKFIKRWQEINDRMYYDKKFHAKYHAKYAGINQAAFGYMIEQENRDIKLDTVPCMRYNCTDEGWHLINDDCHAIHYKGRLRDAVLGLRPVNARTRKGFDIWVQYGDYTERGPIVVKRGNRRRKKRISIQTANQTKGRV